MAKSKNNVITHGLSGKIGDLLIFRQIKGTTIVTKIPRRTKPPTPKQNETRQKFRRANSYAQTVLANPELKQAYEQAATSHNTAFNMAIADYMSPPQVEQPDLTAYSGQIGDPIRITIKNILPVQKVTVSITGPGDTHIEHGEAQPEKEKSTWTYYAATGNNNPSGSKIEITATDLPGNTVRIIQEIR